MISLIKLEIFNEKKLKFFEGCSVVDITKQNIFSTCICTLSYTSQIATVCQKFVNNVEHTTIFQECKAKFNIKYLLYQARFVLLINRQQNSYKLSFPSYIRVDSHHQQHCTRIFKKRKNISGSKYSGSHLCCRKDLKELR